MNFKQAASELLESQYRYKSSELFKIESISKIRRYGNKTYNAFSHEKSDFFPMFLYLITLEQVFIDLGNIDDD
jgi:hypothetical protein